MVRQISLGFRETAASESSTAWSRRSGEGLRDRQPALGVVAICGHIERGTRPPLGDQQAEALGRSRDPLWCILGSPRPSGAVGRKQLDPKRIRRHGKAVDCEREVSRPDPDVRDGAQPRGRGPRHAERVGHVEAVCPGLHQPCGGHRRGAHRRPEPGQLVGVGHGQQRVMQSASCMSPIGEQLGRRGSGDPFCAPVDEPARVFGGRPEHFGEARLVVDRQQCDAIRPQ